MMFTKLFSSAIALAFLSAVSFAECPVPPDPTNVGAEATSPYSIRFHVDRVIAGQRGFHAERQMDGGPFQVINSGYPHGTLNDSFELIPGHEFCYRTRAFNSCGQVSNYTPVVMVQLPAAPMPYQGLPGNPTNLTAVLTAKRSVQLNWTAGAFPGVNGQNQIFSIERSPAGLNSWGKIQAAVKVGDIDGSVTSGKSYTYRIRAFNGFGWGGFEGNCLPNDSPCGTAYSNLVTISIP